MSSGRGQAVVDPESLLDGRMTISTAAELLAAIEGRIQRAELTAGDRLPPVRRAATALGVAPNTVAAAYRQLTERGLAVGDGRRGTFVTDSTPTEQPTRLGVGHDVIDLASGNPDRNLLPELRPALLAIRTDHVAYGTAPIDPDLAALLLADIAGDLDIGDVSAEQNLAVVGGALDGIERVMTSQLRRGDRVAVEDPGYTSVLHLVKSLGLRPIPLTIDPTGPTPEGLTEAVDGGAKAVIVTPRAQNPTGAAVSGRRAAELRAILSTRPDLLIIEDDHAGPVAGVPHHSLIGPDTARWAVIRSLAKSLGPDLRIAGMVGDPTTVSRVIGRQMLGTGWVSHLLQRTAAHLLAAPETPNILDRAATAYRTRRTVASELLAARGIEAWAASGLNVWIPVPDEAHVVAGLQQQGYAVLAGSRFRQRSGPAVRLSIGSADVETITGATEALADLLTSRPARRTA